MILVGILVAACNGRIGSVGTAAIDSSKDAVMLCITMLGVMSMWTGLMNIAKKAGIIDRLTKGLRPVLAFLFPTVPGDHPANEYIAANIISTDMCTFLIINISSLQLIPVNIIAYRSQYGSVSPHFHSGNGTGSHTYFCGSRGSFCHIRQNPGREERPMNILYFLSDCMIPLVIVLVVAYGMFKKVDVFDEFIEGAKDGFLTVYKIMPTLIGLMIGVGILRESLAMDYLAAILAPVVKLFHFPGELLPLFIVKMFSSSAATGLLLDIYKTYGTDSYLGTLSSVLMSCSETIFYTMSVYFMTAKVTKTRYTLAGALFATFVGAIASVLLVGVR